jgi:hypothetical protein
MTPPTNANTRLIDQLVIAYNKHDARAFADCFSENAIHGILHSPTQQCGREEIYLRYVQFFSEFPNNKTQIAHRIAFGDFVVDHEVVRRTPESGPINVIAIHEFKEGVLQRLDFIRE